MMLKILLIIPLLFVFSCSQHDINDYKEETPVFNPKSFFSGNLVAKGIVTDRSGKVIRRFHCDIVGTWQGNSGKLAEEFIYSDGEKQTRIWELEYTPSENYLTGKAGDIEGIATGEIRGNAFHFLYTLKIEIDGTTYDISVDDWMYLLDENTLMAKSKMTKWSFDVGEVTLVMTRK